MMTRHGLLSFSPRTLRVAAVGAAVVMGAGVAVVNRATAQQQNFDNVQIETIQVRPNIHMLVGAGGNTTVMSGPDGVLVVDTQFAPLGTKILDAIKRIAGDNPIRYVVNTHMHPDHIGANEQIAKAGRTRAGGNVVGDIGAAATSSAAVIAHENVMNRLMKPPAGQAETPFAALPTETFFNNQRDMLFNGEAVQMLHQPNAHTDGDILVFFRGSDVVATGDLFTTVMYPFLDQANGGSVTGYIKALNNILNITVPSNVNEGGTMVIPGHGRLSDEQDVIEYRDMLTIVRDRIQAYARKGMTLDQVKAQKPTLDWDARYGTDTGFWTTNMFIEAIYKEMAAANPPANRNQRNQRNQNRGSGE